MSLDPTSISFLLLITGLALAVIMIAIDAVVGFYVHSLYRATFAKLMADDDFKNLLLSSNVSSKEIAKRVIQEHEKTAAKFVKEIARDMTRNRIKRMVEKERRQTMLNSLSYWKSQSSEESNRQIA